MANWPLSAAINYVMRLSVLSPFKESARLVGVYDNILAGTIFFILSYRYMYLPPLTYWQLAKVGVAVAVAGKIYIFVFYEALWLKASFYGFVDTHFSQSRNILRVSRVSM